jgi:hypothetical protein
MNQIQAPRQQGTDADESSSQIGWDFIKNDPQSKLPDHLSNVPQERDQISGMPDVEIAGTRLETDDASHNIQ